MDITNIQNSDESQLPSVVEWKKWQEEFLEGIEKKIMKNPNLLDTEMRNYIAKARFQVYNVFRSPPTACIMGEYVGYAMRFFADLEQSIFKRRVDLKDYYHSMSELLAMYCDLRVNALLLYKDRVDETRQQFLHMFRQFLANNCDYITNALLRIQRLKLSRLLFENMFRFVEQNANFERTHTNCVSYCRYILFYRQWKKMYSDIMVLREISSRAVERLKPPPNFRKHKLFEMLRPKNSAIPPNLTLFFLTAPIHTNLVVDKFFSVDEYESETPALDDLYEVVDLTDEVQSPKREDESLERQQQVNRTTNNRCSEDTYNLMLSFNNMMNIDKPASTQQTNIINQPTSLSTYLHRNDQQPSWSPITRNLITNTNKDHQESIDTGIFSDRSFGNSPAYEMEVKDVHVVTSTPSISVNDKVITRVISSSCDKCGHKSSSSIVDVLPPSSIQQTPTTKTSIPPLSPSKASVIVILDDEEDNVEQSHRNNFDQVTQQTVVMEQSQENCYQEEVLVPGDKQNDVIFENSERSNNEESKIIQIEDVTPPSSQPIDESNASPQVESTKNVQIANISDNKLISTALSTSIKSSELTSDVDVDNMIHDSDLTQVIDNRTLNIKKTNLKDVGVSTQDIMDSEQEMHDNVLDSGDHLIKRDINSKVRVMSVVDVTPNTSIDENNGKEILEQPSSSTNQVADVLHKTNTFTIDKSRYDTVIGIQSNNDEEDVENVTPMNVDVNNDKDEEVIDTDMDTQQFVDQMFCSKPIEPINNKKKKQKIDSNKDPSGKDNDTDNDESDNYTVATYLKSPQSDGYFYGFSNNNSSNNTGSDLLKSLTSNNNNSLSSSSLFNNNNDHSQCSIHLQNATRQTEQFVSTTRTRDQHQQLKNQNINNKKLSIIEEKTPNINNKNTNKNTKSILKTSKKTTTINNNDNTNSTNTRKKSVVLSKDSYTRYIHEDEKVGHHHYRKQQIGTTTSSSSSLMQMLGQSKKSGSIIIAENHYDKPEESRRHAHYQDFREYHQQREHQENRRVLRQRSESRDRDPFRKYLHPTCQESYIQPKDLENGRYVPRRRRRSYSMCENQNYNSSSNKEPLLTKRTRFDSVNENRRVTRSRSNDRNRSFEDNSLYKNTTQSVRGQSNPRNRAKTNSEEEKKLLYEKLRRKYNILMQVQIILNERNNLSLESYLKKLSEENSHSNNKKSDDRRRNSRRKSINYNVDGEMNMDDISSRDSEELTSESSNDHRKLRLSNRRNSTTNDPSFGRRRGRSRTRIKRDRTLRNSDITEKSNSKDRLTPTSSESMYKKTIPTTSTENMYPSTTYFSSPVRIPECLQASTTTPKNDEIRVPSIQSSIERLQNSLASPISLLASENTTTDTTFNDTNLNNKKFNSIKSGNLIKSNVTKKRLINIFNDDDDVPDDSENEQNVPDDHENDQNVSVNHENEQDLDELSLDMNVNERPQLRTKGARKLLKDEINRPMRQCRRSSSTNNRIFSTDTSSTRRLRKTEYLKTFRHVTGDLEDEQPTNDDEVTTSTTTITTNALTITSATVNDSKLSWEHYNNLSPEKQQVSIVENNVDDDDESNHIYDELSTIVKSSDHEKSFKTNYQNLQINDVNVDENNKSSTDKKENCVSDNSRIEIANPITPMTDIAALEQLQNDTPRPVTPITDTTQLEHSNDHLDIVNDEKIKIAQHSTLINNKKVTQMKTKNKNKKVNEVKPNKNINNNKKNQIKTNQIKQQTTNDVKSNKQLKTKSTSKKDISSKLLLFDLLEEIDQQINHVLIPNVRKRRLLSCITSTPSSNSDIVIDDQHLQIKDVDGVENDKSSTSTDKQQNCVSDRSHIEIPDPATPILSFAALQNDAPRPVTPMTDTTQLEHSNDHLNIVNDEEIKITQHSTLINNKKITQIKTKNKKFKEVKTNKNIKNDKKHQIKQQTTNDHLQINDVVDRDANDKSPTSTDEQQNYVSDSIHIETPYPATTMLSIAALDHYKILQSQNNTSHPVTQMTDVAKLEQSNDHLDIVNDEKIMIAQHPTLIDSKKLTQMKTKNKKFNDVKSNKNINNDIKHQIKQQTTNDEKNLKQLKTVLKKGLSTPRKDVPSKLRFSDTVGEIEHKQKSHLLIPKARKRRLSNFATSTPNSNSVLVNATVVSDEDDDDNISLAELKRRNVILIKKDANLKHFNNKLNKRASKSHKNCDTINNLNVSGRSTPAGTIILTLDEIETCDISVVSCEEVVGEGTILLNNANTIHKSSTITNNKPAPTTTTKVNFSSDTKDATVQ